MCTSSGHTMDHHDDMVCAARVQDHLRGGVHSFSFDRRHADADPEAAQAVRHILRRERHFLTKAVLFMLNRGIRQFLDLGSGLPSSGGVHHTVDYLAPEARVVHVDADLATVEHGRLIVDEAGRRAYFLCADVTYSEQVMVDCVERGLLDLRKPVGLLAVGLPHLLPPSPRLFSFLPCYGAALVSGSALALTHLTPWFATHFRQSAARLITGPGGRLYPRKRCGIVPMFDGFNLVKPGIVSLSSRWEWGLPTPETGEEGEATMLAGLGVKP